MQKHINEEEIEESCSVVKQQPLELGHLKVEVRCNRYSAMVRKVVRILVDNGINCITFDFY
jgi:hypothetical protein